MRRPRRLDGAEGVQPPPVVEFAFEPRRCHDGHPPGILRRAETELAGLHWRFSVEEGTTIGRAVAAMVLRSDE